MVVRSLRRGLLPRREADEIDRLARLLARGIGAAIAQERAGHDVGKHRHAAERLCDLEGARQPERADVMRPQADDFLAEGQDRSGVRAGESR